MIAGKDHLFRRSKPVSGIRIVIPGIDDPVLIDRFGEITAGLYRTDLDEIRLHIRFIRCSRLSGLHGDVDQIL